MSRLSKLPWMGATFAVMLLVGVMAGAAIADNGGDVFYACEKDGNIVSGSVMVNEEPTCKGGKTLVSWSSDGPQGPVGPAGPAGPPGPW